MSGIANAKAAFEAELEAGFPSPCGVNIVGNLKGKLTWLINYKRFPSPCGVNIVGNPTDLVEPTWDNAQFPSPCGVNIVGNSWQEWTTGQRCHNLVSVPLRGKYCRESSDRAVEIDGQIQFPSPCGVNIVGNACGSTWNPGPTQKGFRPLAG